MGRVPGGRPEPNPHGGIGFLEYRNLLSNYFRFTGSGELERRLEPYNLDGIGRKGTGGQEPFLAVEYVDLHVLGGGCRSTYSTGTGTTQRCS